MGDVSTHFSKSEIDCNCGCGLCIIDKPTLNMMEKIRTLAGKLVHITCWCRCVPHNNAIYKKLGLKPTNSQHLKKNGCKGVDFHIDDMTVDQMAVLAQKAGADGIGKYYGKRGNFVHADKRGYKSRWEER